MSRLLALVGAIAGGWIGWWLGSQLGVMTAYLLSVVGTAGGVYLGHRIAREHFE